MTLTFKQYLTEEIAQTKRTGIIHLQNMRPIEFLEFAHEIQNTFKGKLKDIEVSLKADGAGCLPYDAIVDTLEYGKIEIGKIVQEQLSVHVKSFDGIDVVFKKVTNFQELNESNNWYEMTLENGQTLKLTGEHLVFLPELQCWRRMDELIEGDSILFEN